MADRPYFREFTVAQDNTLLVPDDADVQIFEIGFPQNGKIIAMSIRQVAGTNIAAQFNLYRNLPPEDPTDAARALYRIVPADQLVVAPGVPLERKWDGYYYMNTEGTTTVPVRKIYLEITPTHADPATDSQWEVSIGCIAGVHA